MAVGRAQQHDIRYGKRGTDKVTLALTLALTPTLIPNPNPHPTPNPARWSSLLRRKPPRAADLPARCAAASNERPG